MIQTIKQLALTALVAALAPSAPLFCLNEYETYLESWDSNWQAAMTGLPPTPSSSPTNSNNVVLNIAFASYTFPGLNGVQFSNPSTDVQTILDFAHAQQGKVKISFGGASYAGPNYFISQTYGWPGNISTLVSGVSEVVNSYGFDGVDFDIEDPLPTGVEEEDFANQLYSFLDKVRTALPGKLLSLTIPAQGWGTYWKILAQKLVGTNIVDTINFMEYDLWMGVPSYVQQIEADIITYTSPTNVYPAPNYSEGWGIPPAMIRLGLMPGNDDTSQFLSVDDAKTLTNYAMSMKLSGVMTWDLNRDAGTDPNPSLEGAAPYAYSNAIRSILYQASLNPAAFKKPKKTKSTTSRIQARTLRPRFNRQSPPLNGAPPFA